MAGFSLNRTLIFVVISAFLAVQLTVDHIHLADHHDHGGSHHKHHSQAHNYHLADYHADAIDVSHETNDTNVVNIDLERNPLQRECQDNPSADAVSFVFQWVSSSLSVNPDFEEPVNAKYSQLDRASTNPRAPPLAS